MRVLAAFIFDQRYSVPTLLLAEPVAEGHEEAHAERLLGQSAYYDAVELRDGDDLVTRVDRDRPPHERRAYRNTGMGA